MKLFNKLLLIMFATTLFVACDDEDYPMLNPSAETVVSLSSSNLLLVKDDADNDALTVTWTEPSYGFEAAPTYRINFINGDKTNSVDAGTDLSRTFTVGELNGILLNAGLEGDVATQVMVRVDAVLSAYKEIPSNMADLNVTAYPDDLDLSTEWGVVGSATANGWDGPDQPFYLTNDPDVIAAYVTLTDGFIKFRTNNSWDLNYGDADDDPTTNNLSEGGSDIPVTAGEYRILFNTALLTYEIELYSWGLVGSGTPNGWDGPDVRMEYNPLRDTWVATATLIDGEMKFRLNNDWPGNLGDNDTDGTLEPDGANIPVSAGEATVTLDLNKNTYSIRY